MNGLFGGGDGTINNPYLVEDAADLHIGVRNKASEGIAYYFKQTADISLDEYGSVIIQYYNTYGHDRISLGIKFGTDIEKIYLDGELVKEIEVKRNETDGWLPINLNNSSYDGNNKIIANMSTFSRVYSTGLFSEINSGYIKNIILENCQIYLRDSITNAGFIVGKSYTNTSILNCKVIANTEFNMQASKFGGIVGECLGEIYGCTFKGSIESYASYVGGIVGYYDSDKSIKKCKVIATIKAPECGGIASYSSADIEQSVFSGIILDTKTTIGLVSAPIVLNGKGLYECASYINTPDNVYPENIYQPAFLLAKTLTGNIKNCYGILMYSSTPVPLVSNLDGYIDTSYGIILNHNGGGTLYKDEDKIGEYVFTNYGTWIGDGVTDPYENRLNYLRDINTYTGYNNKLYILEVEPGNNLGNNGDVVILPAVRRSIVVDKVDYIVEADICEYISYIKNNGTWDKTITYDITEYYVGGRGTHIEEILEQLDKEDYYLYNYSRWVSGVGTIDNRGYIYLGDIIEVPKGVDSYWQWIDIGQRPFSPKYEYKRPYKIGAEYIQYRQAKPGFVNANNENQFNLIDIWDIYSEINNGFPILRNIDYEDILEMYLGIIKVQASNELVTIPLYSITNEGNRLTVSTSKGLAEIKLVDINDVKASPVRMMTANGIKSWSK